MFILSTHLGYIQALRKQSGHRLPNYYNRKTPAQDSYMLFDPHMIDQAYNSYYNIYLHYPPVPYSSSSSSFFLRLKMSMAKHRHRVPSMEDQALYNLPLQLID